MTTSRTASKLQPPPQYGYQCLDLPCGSGFAELDHRTKHLETNLGGEQAVDIVFREHVFRGKKNTIVYVFEVARRLGSLVRFKSQNQTTKRF